MSILNKMSAIYRLNMQTFRNFRILYFNFLNLMIWLLQFCICKQRTRNRVITRMRVAYVKVIQEEITLHIPFFIPLIPNIKRARLIRRKYLHDLVFVLPFREPNFTSKSDLRSYRCPLLVSIAAPIRVVKSEPKLEANQIQPFLNDKAVSQIIEIKVLMEVRR